ncbi:MAG: hypothetical protein AB7T22_14975 [Calditrichaceae bacterium]
MDIKKSTILLLIITGFLILNCATVLKGYKDKVSIKTSDNIEIYNSDGEKLLVSQAVVKTDTVKFVYSKIETGVADTSDSYFHHILSYPYLELRSNEVHKLTVNTENNSKNIVLYPKIGLGWAALDFACGIFPLVIDLYTGNLNHFDDIEIQSEK